MKLSHFAQALTLALIAVTAYLAWQAQEDSSKANAKMDLFTQQQKAVQQAQTQAAGNPVPGLTTPLVPATTPLAPLPSAEVSTAAKAKESAASLPPLPGPLPEVKPASKPAAQAASKPAGSPAAAVAPTAGDMPLLTPLQRRIKDSPAMGKVKQTFLEQGFVALDVGSKGGLKTGLKFDLRRESAIVGRVTITEVDEAEAVADLDPKSVPEGVKVQAGDELISVVLEH